LFLGHSAKGEFLNKEGKVLFTFSRPVVIIHSANFIRYAAFVFTGMNKMGIMIGEFHELTFHFNSPTQNNETTCA